MAREEGRRKEDGRRKEGRLFMRPLRQGCGAGEPTPLLLAHLGLHPLGLDVVNGVRRLDVFAMAGPPRREAAAAPVMPRGARPAEPAQVERDYLPPVDALAVLADLELLAR